MDADLSHDPAKLSKIAKLLDTSEFVIGSRYVKGGKCEMNLRRYLISIVGNKFIKIFLGINSNEFTSAYRGFNILKLKKFSLKTINSKGYSFFMETVYLINKQKFNIKEIPIRFKNRIYGKSKIPKIEIFRTLLNVLRLKLNL